jgi:hypothetical protein
MPLAQEVLRDVLRQEERAVTIEMIQKFVADYYQLKMVELKSRKQLQVGRHAAAGGDVFVQATHKRLVAGNRQKFWRETPLDGHPLGPQG